MLALWMFGTELERIWGTRVLPEVLLRDRHRRGGADRAVLAAAVRLRRRSCSDSIIIGASGAIYGLLLAYALYFPDRPIYMYLVFPIPAKYFVMIMGAIAFYSSLADSSGVANATHLGGLLVGYLYLKGARMHPLAEVKYRYLRWKINRDAEEVRRLLRRPRRTTGTAAFTDARSARLRLRRRSTPASRAGRD